MFGLCQRPTLFGDVGIIILFGVPLGREAFPFDERAVDGLEEASHGHVDISVGPFQQDAEPEVIAQFGGFPNQAPLQRNAGRYLEIVSKEFEGVEFVNFHGFMRSG